ncbi:MAG TPA: hypothetical protein VJ878_00725, partial [Candidatus Izemoplasmatales bacterium]|nr:hypothetical protein [Candidatus Izemoplasmatales bacterium]
MKIIKWIKRLIILLVFIIIAIGIGGIIYLNSVHVEVTDDDLPQDVYGNANYLSIRLQTKIFQIVTADEGAVDNHIEDYINLMVYKTIKDDVNEFYDPIHGDSAESQYIVSNQWVEIDYIIAEILDNKEVKVTVSIKRNVFPKAMTAIYFYFDMNFNFTSMKMKLALNNVYIDDKEISRNVYDRIIDMAGQESIENAVDKGTLDLDEYTYIIT